MRLLSATGFVVAAMLAGGCISRGTLPQAPRDGEIVTKLKNLGVEGLTYQNNLGAHDSIFLKDVHTIGADLLIEDIHGHLVYVDGPSMNPKWQFNGMPSAFDEKPDYTPSAIIGIASGELYVITRFNGVESPSHSRVPLVASAAPVATESTLYVPTYATPKSGKNVQTVSIGSGYVGWGVRTSGEITADVAKGGPLGGDTIYVGTTNGSVYAFPTAASNRPSPGTAWSMSVNSPVFFDLEVEGSDLGVVTSDARLVCIDRGTGTVRWKAHPNPRERAESGAQFSQSLAFYRVSGELRAFNRDSGESAWNLDGGRRFLAERDDFVLIGGDNGWIYQVDTKTGEVRAEEHLPGVTIPSRTAPNGTIVVVTNRGLMVGVEYGF